jgi:hypothetical protein
MIRRTFTWDDGRTGKYGEAGWLPAWMGNIVETFDPGVDIAVAHDALEHRLCDRGEFYQEAMAFGAMLYTRWQNGYFSHFGKSADWLGGDLFDLWLDAGMPSLAPFPANRSVNCNDPLVPEAEAQAWFAKYNAADKLEERGLDPELDKPSAAWFSDLEKWIKHGALQAQIRYRHWPSWSMLQAFEEVDRLVRHSRHHYENWHGRRMSIRLDDKNGFPQVSVWYQPDPAFDR